MNPQGVRGPRVLPEFPPGSNRRISSPEYPPGNGTPQPIPKPRKTQLQLQHQSTTDYPGNQSAHATPTDQPIDYPGRAGRSNNNMDAPHRSTSADYPGNQSPHTPLYNDQPGDFPGRAGRSNSNNSPDVPHHFNGAASSTYAGHTALVHSVKDDRTFKQLQEENHLLRMRVEDQAVDNNKKDRDLEYCQDQIRLLTTQLTEKKEELLKSEDRVVNMQADLSESREHVLDLQRGQHNLPGCRPVSSDNEMALQREVNYLQGMLEDVGKEKEYCSMQLERERGQWKQKVMQYEEEIRRCQEQMQMQHREIRQHPPHNYRADYVDGELKSRVEMLEAQVLIYKEDFETEREDRTRAQDNIIKLKEEVASLQQTNELLVSERTRPQPRQR